MSFITRCIFVGCLLGSFVFYGCNRKPEVQAQEVKSDTANSVTTTPIQPISQLPHADTTLIPVLGEIVSAAFEASIKKDLSALGNLIIYRGPEEQRLGVDVFRTGKKFDKSVIKVTADVFSKWAKERTEIEYPRVFELPQPDGSSIPVLEVIVVSKKKVTRRFFIFQQISNDWKIAEVTSYI